MIWAGGKGASAWEFQVGSSRWRSIQVNWVHLVGGIWSRRFMRKRLYIQIWDSQGECVWSWKPGRKK